MAKSSGRGHAVKYDDQSEPSAMGLALRAIRNAPLEKQDQFWTALRESVAAEVDESEADEARHARLRAHRPASGLVYYIRFGDRVKIGYTTNLKSRLRVLPHDEVLATEQGSMSVERARHATFDALRVTGEWFRYEEPLVSHIESLARNTA